MTAPPLAALFLAASMFAALFFAASATVLCTLALLAACCQPLVARAPHPALPLLHASRLLSLPLFPCLWPFAVPAQMPLLHAPAPSRMTKMVVPLQMLRPCPRYAIAARSTSCKQAPLLLLMWLVQAASRDSPVLAMQPCPWLVSIPPILQQPSLFAGMCALVLPGEVACYCASPAHSCLTALSTCDHSRVSQCLQPCSPSHPVVQLHLSFPSVPDAGSSDGADVALALRWDLRQNRAAATGASSCSSGDRGRRSNCYACSHIGDSSRYSASRAFSRPASTSGGTSNSSSIR